MMITSVDINSQYHRFLSHKNARLRQDAHDDLLVIGEPARSLLLKAERRARPDHKATYRAILDAIDERD